MLGLDLEQLSVVDDPLHERVHVVRLGGLTRDQLVELRVGAVGAIARRQARGILAVVLRQERQQRPQPFDQRRLVGEGAVGDARADMRRRAPQLLLGDGLVRDGADHVRAGDEHVARRLDHEDEVGDGRRVDRAPRAGAEHAGELRHQPRRQRVAQEDVGVAGQRDDPFLNARAARIVEPDDRRARLHGQVHDLADLARVRLGQRAAEHGEVLREQEDRAAVDGAVAGDHAVAQDLVVAEAEVGRAVGDQLVELDEAVGVAEQRHPLARGQLAGLVLARDARGAPRLPCLLFQRRERGEAIRLAGVAHTGSSSLSIT